MIEGFDGHEGKQKLPTPTIAPTSLPPATTRAAIMKEIRTVPGAIARDNSIKATTTVRQWGTQRYEIDCIKNGRKTDSNISVRDQEET